MIVLTYNMTLNQCSTLEKITKNKCQSGIFVDMCNIVICRQKYAEESAPG